MVRMGGQYVSIAGKDALAFAVGECDMGECAAACLAPVGIASTDVAVLGNWVLYSIEYSSRLVDGVVVGPIGHSSDRVWLVVQ